MSPTHVSRRAIVADWAGAGAFFGMSLGAAYGLLWGIAAIFGQPTAGPLAAIFVLFGAVVGLAAGLVIGVIDGLVLAVLFSAGALGRTEDGRSRRAALAAGLTSAVVSFSLFDWALGGPGQPTPTWLFVYVPAAVATLAAVALSQRLEPTRPEARSGEAYSLDRSSSPR